MLQAAASIETWISLIAFAIAAVLIAYRSNLKTQENIISGAPANQRVTMLNALAQKYGVNIQELSNDQIYDIVIRNINTKRYYAFLGFICALAVALAGIAFFIFSGGKAYEQVIGPLTLRPGETRSKAIELSRKSIVTVYVDSIVPDWSGFEAKHNEFLAKNKGKTPELSIKACGSLERGSICQAEAGQIGMNGTFSREINQGNGSVTFFNFGENPPISFSATIKYQ